MYVVCGDYATENKERGDHLPLSVGDRQVTWWYCIGLETTLVQQYLYSSIFTPKKKVYDLDYEYTYTVYCCVRTRATAAAVYDPASFTIMVQTFTHSCLWSAHRTHQAGPSQLRERVGAHTTNQ